MPPRSSSRKPPVPPIPTAAEVDILAVLWRLGPATVREVHEALGKDSGYTTTLKQMQLMLDKGLLARTERFRSHVYESRVPKDQMQQRIAGDLLRRVFEGSAKELVMGALGAQPASAEELADIRHMIDAFDKKKRGSK
ncbi:MAG: BlaI/MecI/CopY family transcriptional regulator [Acidobacteriia bacterium]|nr:BlaI/MecI/CopY family transcriptional regulator [Terriglobia bacterium]